MTDYSYILGRTFWQIFLVKKRTGSSVVS